MSNRAILFRLLGIWAVSWVVPPVLCHYLGPAVGALGAAAAAAFWYFQYRFPARKERSGAYFWYVTSGYGFIGVTLAVCLGRLVGVNLL